MAVHPSALAADFDWTLVRSFLAVLEAGSLTAAARGSGLSQPTLSRQVAELEAQLAAPLFERTGRGVQPTAAALAIADAARHMQSGAGDLARALARQRSDGSGTVRLTTSRVAAAWLLPPLLAELAAAEPGLQVELVASDTVDNLLRREADIALRMARPTQGSLVARRLHEIALTAAAHRSYLAAAGTPHTPEDLWQHRLLGYDRDDRLLRGAAALGWPLTRANFALRTDDLAAYSQLVAAGAGVGFVAVYQVAQWPGVQCVVPSLRIPPLPCWLAVHREIRGSVRVRRVYDFLAETVPQALQRWEAAV
jgi:DNA-binding transcriptional LysR family regulator